MQLWQCGNFKIWLYVLPCFWNIPQIQLESRTEQSEIFLGLSFLYIYAPLGFMISFTSSQHFLVAIGLIITVDVRPILWRCPALDAVVVIGLITTVDVHPVFRRCPAWISFIVTAAVIHQSSVAQAVK